MDTLESPHLQLLPAQRDYTLNYLRPYLDAAKAGLEKLNAAKNNKLLNYLFCRQEASDSLSLERQDTKLLALIIYENTAHTNQIEPLEDASNLLTAMHYAQERFKKGQTLSTQLLCYLHEMIYPINHLNGQAAGLRQIQNWIGGTNLHNALYVPPSPDVLPELIAHFDLMIQEQVDSLDPLLYSAVLTVGLDTLHPFSCGNRVMGRLFTSLWLQQNNLCPQLLLPLSRYYLLNTDLYLDRLQQVKRHQAWNDWFVFYLKAVAATCDDVLIKEKRMNQLFEQDLVKIQQLGRTRFSCLAVFEHLKLCPEIGVSDLATALNMSAPTARMSLNTLVELNILEEETGKKRDKIYVWKQYLKCIE